MADENIYSNDAFVEDQISQNDDPHAYEQLDVMENKSNLSEIELDIVKSNAGKTKMKITWKRLLLFVVTLSTIIALIQVLIAILVLKAMLRNDLFQLSNDFQTLKMNTSSQESINEGIQLKITEIEQRFQSLTNVTESTNSDIQMKITAIEQRLMSLTNFTDCLHIYQSNNGNVNNGVYRITSNLHLLFDVYCDMANGGWTVIQRRISDSVNFTRGLNDYVSGFGELTNNFWLGLEYIHALTNPAVDIFFDVITEDTNERATSMYNNFTVEGQNNNFMMRVNVTGFFNDVALQRNYNSLNGFGYHNNGYFATFDRTDSNKCVLNWGYGGWWYNNCWVVLLNNQFNKMSMASSNYKPGVVKSSEIKIKRSLN